MSRVIIDKRPIVHLSDMEPHGQSPWYLHGLWRNPPKHTFLRTRLRRVILFVFINGHRPYLHAEVSSVSERRRGLLRRRIKTGTERLYLSTEKGERMVEKKRFSLGKFLKIYVGYLLFRFSTFWVNCLPVESLASWGEKLGLLGFHLLRGWRRVAFANLNLVFGKEKSKDEIHWICRELFKNIARDMLETYRCPGFKDSYFKNLVKLEGEEHLKDALNQGKGVIGLSAHLGNFHLMGARFARGGYPTSYITRDPENPKIAKAINSIKDAVGLETINDEPRMACVSKCFKALKENRILLLQIDQNAPVTEAWVDFFGYLVPTFKGPVLFSMRTGAPILPMFMRRNSNNLHQITIHPPFTLTITGNAEQDITSNTARLTKLIEAAIREYPEQWLWIYRRFKRARDVKTGERLFTKPR